jgi:hypothetical protein
VSDKDLPAVQDVRKSDAAVILPFLEDVKIVDEDNEVIGLALVEDLGSGVVTTSHCEECVLDFEKRKSARVC